jgi:hypothetical protein
VIDSGESFIEPPVMIENRSPAVDIERRSETVGDLGEIGAFAIEPAILIMKRMHASACLLRANRATETGARERQPLGRRL